MQVMVRKPKGIPHTYKYLGYNPNSRFLDRLDKQ